MGIKLNKEYKSGVIGEYWKIEEFKYDYQNKTIQVNLKNYLNYKVSIEGKQFIGSEIWVSLEIDIDKINKGKIKEALYVELMSLKIDKKNKDIYKEKWNEGTEVLEKGQKIEYKKGDALIKLK